MFLAVALLSYEAPPALGSSFGTAPALSAATTTTTVAITTSARIMATTTNLLTPTLSYTRAYAVICNPNANPVWLNFDNDKAANLVTGNVTTVIAAAAGYNACYELTDDRMIYNGSVTASSTAQTSTTITVKQYVY